MSGAPDFDDDLWDDPNRYAADIEPIPQCAICGAINVREACGQCGTPLCPTCFSAGGGFCLRPCPTKSYRPNTF